MSGRPNADDDTSDDELLDRLRKSAELGLNPEKMLSAAVLDGMDPQRALRILQRLRNEKGTP